MTDILTSIGRFFSYLLLNPLWYIGLIVIFMLSLRRINRERKHFNTRVYNVISDFTIPFVPSIIAGVCASLITIVAGVVITHSFIYLIVVLYVIAIFTFQLRWMAPAYVFGMMLLIYGFGPYVNDVYVIRLAYEAVSVIPISVIVGMTALLVFMEAMLIRINGATYTSPQLEEGKRGKNIGSHVMKRMWILPVFFFIPEGIIPSFSYWPLFSIGESSWQPIILPILIGCNQKVQATVPFLFMKNVQKRVLLLSVLLFGLAVSSYYVPMLGIVAGFVAIIGRELIHIISKRKDAHRAPLYSMKSEGCVVLGVLPGSPAEKMNIVVGETVVKVNDQQVHCNVTFYEALQRNPAFCKIEVVDHDGEVRFVTSALYEGEHHQIGLLFVKDEIILQDSVI